MSSLHLVIILLSCLTQKEILGLKFLVSIKANPEHFFFQMRKCLLPPSIYKLGYSDAHFFVLSFDLLKFISSYTMMKKSELSECTDHPHDAHDISYSLWLTSLTSAQNLTLLALGFAYA